MATVHMIVGTLVLLAFLVSAILNIMTFVNGRTFTWQRTVSFVAATVLLIQYVLGFSLLGEGKDMTAAHYLIALCAIIPVGFEHGYAMTRTNLRQRALYLSLANVVTLVIVIIAYSIGQSNA